MKLARQGLTDQQIKDILHSKTGSRDVKFRFDVMKNGVKIADADMMFASVDFNSQNDINRTARFVMRKKIDWINCTIKPYMLVKAVTEWVEFPLGDFIPSTPIQKWEDGVQRYEVEAYDKTIILREDCIVERLFFAVGTKYTDAIQQIMISAGIDQIICDDCETVLPTDREFEIGDSKLKIINTLLSEINFNPVHVNADGVFVLNKYITPSVNNITYRYKDDELSVLGNNSTSEFDLFNAPNIFIAVVSNPELPSDLKSVFTNNHTTSPLSTISRKRNIVSDIYMPDAIATQEDLDAYIKRVAFESSQIYEQAEIETALMPIHERSEVLEIKSGDIYGVYVETGWSMELKAGAMMRHKVRRLMEI